jgi:cytochrome c oxidase subunit 1
VQGRYPVWENAPDAPVISGLDETKRESLLTTTLDATPDHRYDVAGESFWPLLTAIALAYILIGGGMFHPIHAVIGACLITLTLFGWFWTSDDLRNDPSKLARISRRWVS